MARVPYQGVPTVQSTGPSGQYENISPSPAEFGGLIGQAEQRLGPGVEQAGSDLFQTAVRIQDFNNVRDARNANNTFMNDLGQQYAQYAALQGQAAVDAYPTFQKNMNESLQKTAASLQSPAAQKDFLNSAHYMMSRMMMSASVHAAQQQRQSWVTSNEATIATQTQHAILMQNDPNSILLGENQITAAVHDNAMHLQLSPEETQAAVNKTLGHYYLSVIESQATTNPSLAMATFEGAKSKMDPTSLVMAERSLRTADSRAAVAAGANAVLGGGGMAAPSGAGHISDDIAGAIHGQEGSRATAVSTAGAVGEWQVTPPFFQQYARPGEDFNKEADRAAVAQRGIAQLEQKYNGDPSRVAVAYFSGEGNVAPAGSPTPWLADKRDTNGFPTSAYVQGVLSRLKGGGAPVPAPGAAEPGAQAPSRHQPWAYTQEATLVNNAWADARSRFPDRPDLQRQEVSAVYEQIQQNNILQQKFETEQQKAVKDNQDKVLNDAITILNADPTKYNPAMLEAKNADGSYVLTPTQRDSMYQVVKRAMAEHGIEDTAPYGKGYSQAYKDIFAEPDDPNRIKDVNDILRRGGPDGDLSTTGVEKLARIFQASRKDPDAAAVNRTESSMLTYAKNKLSFEAEYGNFKIHDPKGEAIFNAQFVPKFEAGLAAAKQSGKPGDVWQYMSQENVDKMMSGLRSQADMARDRLLATGQLTPADEDKPGAPLPPVPALKAPPGGKATEVNPLEWRDVMDGPRPVSESGQAYTHAAWAEYLGRLLQNPDEKTMRYFDQHFGAQGFSAKELVEKLTRQRDVPVLPSGAPSAVIPPM